MSGTYTVQTQVNSDRHCANGFIKPRSPPIHGLDMSDLTPTPLPSDEIPAPVTQAQTDAAIRKHRGAECANCGAFVLLDDVTDGVPPIEGEQVPRATYSLTPPMRCAECGYQTAYMVSDLQIRSY